MTDKWDYPLAQVLDVKRRRVEEAEKAVKARKEELEREEKTLKKLEEKRDEVLNHKNEKLAQLRAALDEGTTSTEVKQMKDYLALIKEKLAAEEAKVAEQKKKVDEAKKLLEEAEKLLRERRLEEDKLKEHRKDWERKAKKQMQIEEERKADDLGQTMHISKQWRKE